MVNLKVEQGKITRRKLLDTARRVFTEKGYEQVSAEELVSEAGVTRGALYHHFDDKRDLFRTLVWEMQDELNQRVTEGALTATDAWGAIEDGTTALLEACLEPDIARIIMLDGPAVLGWDVWDEIDAEFAIKQVSLGLEVMMLDKVIDEQPVPPLAKMMVALMNGACRVIAQSDNPRKTLAEVRPALMRLLEGLRID